jgi:hypothetical protein
MSELVTPPEAQQDAGPYLAASSRARYRRLAALIVMSLILVGLLALIYAMGWTDISTGPGASNAGAGWVIVGIGVGVLAIAGVVVDIVYRRDS